VWGGSPRPGAQRFSPCFYWPLPRPAGKFEEDTQEDREAKLSAKWTYILFSKVNTAAMSGPVPRHAHPSSRPASWHRWQTIGNGDCSARACFFRPAAAAAARLQRAPSSTRNPTRRGTWQACTRRVTEDRGGEPEATARATARARGAIDRHDSCRVQER